MGPGVLGTVGRRLSRRFPGDLAQHPVEPHEVPLGVDAVVHGSDGTLVVRDLDPGDHVITVLLADNDDVALALPVPVIVEVTTG